MALADRMKFDRAIEDFSDSIAAYSDNRVALFERGRAYWHTGRYREAANDLRLIVHQSYEDPRWRFHTHALLGDSLLRLGEYDKAILNLSAALNLHEDALVYLSRGHAYTGRGDLDRATADFAEAARLDPSIRLPVPAVPAS
jgi:tetratricopeptide (TPR) repeat protein